ncbi:MAG TPA: phage protein GemA/Gp16 family protein [Dehalococcoidia bacterium]|nr:phage protein GemA/Gp16 family protein [Dehalococcoidia bacterium]
MALNPHMIRLLHVARSKTKMPEEHYRALLSRFGAASSKDARLQPRDYHEMMEVFAQLGFRPAPKPGTAQGGTRAQLRLIDRLCREHEVNAQRRAGIVKHVTGKDSEKWCDKKDLSKVIQALKRWRWEKAS